MPEIVILGDRVLYMVRYDPGGTADGAWRIDDRDTIIQCRIELADLFATGEPILEFFRREIAPLPPPAVPA